MTQTRLSAFFLSAVLVFLSAFSGLSLMANVANAKKCDMASVPCDFLEDPETCCLSITSVPHCSGDGKDCVSTISKCGSEFGTVLEFCLDPLLIPCGVVPDFNCSAS
jgi:hypothetical protein